MMSSFKQFGVVAAIVLVLTALGFRTFAQDPKKEKDKAPPAEQAGAPGVQALADALTMAQLGRAHKQPEALVAAAKLLATVKVTATQETATGTSYDTVAEAKKLLTEAETLTGNNEACLKLIAAAREDLTVSSRGATHGAELLQGKLGAGGSKVYLIKFKGPSTVSLSPGPHRENLTLRIKNLSTGDVRQSLPNFNGSANMNFNGGAGTMYAITVFNSDHLYSWNFALMHN